MLTAVSNQRDPQPLASSSDPGGAPVRPRMTMTTRLAPPARPPVALLADRVDLTRIQEIEGDEESRPVSEGTASKEHNFSLAWIAAASRIEPFPRWGINE